MNGGEGKEKLSCDFEGGENPSMNGGEEEENPSMNGGEDVVQSDAVTL